MRFNFRRLLIDAASYLCACAFLDQSTVIPTFLGTLTNSKFVIGAIMSIKHAGLLLPQLWTAHYLRNRTRHKPFLVRVVMISRMSIVIFAILLFLASPTDRGLMLCGFILMYTIFWVFDGAANVSWHDILAKTIPPRQRGRLLGLMHVVGGSFAVLAGVLVASILAEKGPPYPTNYAILWAVAAVLFGIGLGNLIVIREPDSVPERHDGGLLGYALKIGQTISSHSQLKLLLAIQLLIGFFHMSLPFYILYATDVGGIDGRMVGVLLSVQVLGSMAMSAASGYMSDHINPRSAILLSILAGILASVTILATRGESIWLCGLAFFAIGGTIASSFIGLTNYLLELAAPEDCRMYVSIMYTANAPTVLFPFIGGLIAQQVSYEATFSVTAVALAAATFLTFALKPRSVPAERDTVV